MIPVNEPVLGDREKELLMNCIDTGWISSEGPFVKRFEMEFAARVGRKHAIAVCNGSAALDTAVAALEICPGDEIILPTFTIISCVAAIIRNGATPVLVDADLDTWNMDVEQVESKITEKTRAIMPVHIYGMPVDMDPLLALAHKYKLSIIEDAAEAIGQDYRGRACGSLGDISTFSFYPNKHVTTGEGGMVLTDSDTLAERCRSIRNLCFIPQKRFVHEKLGWNFRMTNLQAALGIAQLENLDAAVIKKRRMGQRYTDLFTDIEDLQLPVAQTDYAENVYWVYGLVLGPERKDDAEVVIRQLTDRGVGTRPFFWPMHKQPILKKMGFFDGESYSVAETISRRGFYVPSGLGLMDQDINEVSQALHEVFE